MKLLKGIEKKPWRLITALIVAVLFLVGCENNDPMAPLPGENQSPKISSQLEFLKLKNDGMTLSKRKKKSKWVNKTQGETIEISHGAANSAQGLIWAVDEDSPYNIYQIKLDDISNPVLAGQLAFKTRAIAVHPDNGLVYYVAAYNNNGAYYLASWDPATNSNTIINTTNTIRTCDKLAFAPDGTLYGVDRDNKYDLYTIDTNDGTWTLDATFTNKHFSAYGDFAFGPDGTFYNANGYNERFQVVDMEAGTINTVDKTGVDDMTGLATASDGQMVFSDDKGKIYAVDPATANATYLGNTGINGLADLASAHFEVELAYADVSLEVLPNSIDVDKEIEISFETTELSGGVAVTFQPHGTIFSPYAILNLTAHGVDFSGIDPNAVDIFYDNQETGQWEPMQRDAVIVDVNAGTVTVINAQLPHFSRYGVAAD